MRRSWKLYEELLIGDNTLPTSHSRIMRAAEHALRWDVLKEGVGGLPSAACQVYQVDQE